MKPEVVFGLENAAWPALLVNAGGAVLMFNGAAKTVFGVALDGNPAQLAAIWSPANRRAVADFLAQWEKSPALLVELKFRATGGLEKKFSTAIALLANEGSKWLDRKSTRLNSSHLGISYAVFCLKKNNKLYCDACT